MKKAILIILIITVIFILLTQPGVSTTLLNFLLIGAIPGTTYTIPSGFMLLATITIIWLIVFRIAALETFFATTKKQVITVRARDKKRLPSRRYNQV